MVVGLVLLFALALSAPLLDVQRPIDGEYIVVLSQDANSVHNHFALLAQLGHVIEAEHVYEIGSFRGYAAPLSDEALDAVLNSTDVAYVEPNAEVYAIGHAHAATCTSQNGATWGITRVSQKALALSNPYTYSESGASVVSYIVDTGINTAHVEFQGRASFGFKANAAWTDNDGNGHGTHVAGTVGGAKHGIAKGVTLIAVKVLGDDGSGTNAGVIAGIQYVTNNAPTRGKRATANMSLGGGASAALDQALTNSIASGVTYAVAAGNDNANACNYSPARCATAITVGSTAVVNEVSKQYDGRSSFSNWGNCVHILAPGSMILSAWKGTTTAYNTISGTSMASPHVCGVATLYLARNPSATPAQVKAALTNMASANLVDLLCPASPVSSNTACKQTPNRLLHNAC